jgi:hypothetical protein
VQKKKKRNDEDNEKEEELEGEEGKVLSRRLVVFSYTGRNSAVSSDYTDRY